MMWRTIADGTLHFRHWDDEVVVYNSLSGDTHLLDEAAARLLLKLQPMPADVEGLAAALAIPDVPASRVEEILLQLDALALVESV